MWNTIIRYLDVVSASLLIGGLVVFLLSAYAAGRTLRRPNTPNNRG